MDSHSITLLTLTLLLSFSTLSSSLPSSAILDAAEILSTSGFQSMAINLELASQTLVPPQTHSLTIFSPTDSAFKQFPHLPLSLLRYHLLPHAFSLNSLSSLPFGANIPTLLPSHSLTVTTTNPLTINNVTVNPSPIFDDGSLVIFSTLNFFDPYFHLPAKKSTKTKTKSPLLPNTVACFAAGKTDDNKWFIPDDVAFSFEEASSVMRSKRCSVMALFLDMQFLALRELPQLTLFAPIDEVMASHVESLGDYSFLLRLHLVPCKITWSDLMRLEDGTLIWTYKRGFTLKVTKSSESNELIKINGVPVSFPELYHSDWLVVHGLREVLTVGSESDGEVSSSSYGFNHFGEGNTPEHYHFSIFH